MMNDWRGLLMERGEQRPDMGGGRAPEAEPRADPPLALEPEARVSTLLNEIDSLFAILCERAEFD